MLGQIQQLFWFQDSRCRYKCSYKVIFKLNSTMAKIALFNLENCHDVHHPNTYSVDRHRQGLPKAHYNVMIHKLRNYKKVKFF